MNPEEMEAYLKSLDNEATSEKLQESMAEDIKYANEWDYYQKQQRYISPYLNPTADIDIDYDMMTEAERLGADYTVGSEYNADNLWEKQGTGEQLKNAGARLFFNTLTDTAAGFASMVDLPGYVDPNKGMFKGVADWAAEQKEKTNEWAPIYQKKDAGMWGPGMSSWWIENAGSLASSAVSFGLQGAGAGAFVSRGAQALKWLNSLKKAEKVKRHGNVLGTGENMARSGRSGTAIGEGLKAGDMAQNVAVSTALNQSAAIMSATESYNSVYNEAIEMGYSDAYAEQVAAQTASNIVNASRANIALNLTMSSRFLNGSKNVKGFKRDAFLPSFKNKKLGAGLTEGAQELVEENVEMIAQEQAEAEAHRAMGTGEMARSKGLVFGDEFYLTGNIYGDASYTDIVETSVLGFLGGPAHVGMATMKGSVGTTGSRLDKATFGAASKMFGHKVEKTHKENVYYPDGSLKFRAGETMVEMEDVMVENEEGELVNEYVESEVEKDKDGKFVREKRQTEKLDEKGNVIVQYEDGLVSANKKVDDEYDRINKPIEAWQKSVEDSAGIIASAKYQAALEENIADINDFIETRDHKKKDKIIDNMARIDMANSGTIDFDTQESKDKLEKNKKELAKEFEKMNERQLRKRADKHKEFSLARVAVESFKSNTKDHLINTFKEIGSLSPEEAKSKGYTDDYKDQVEGAIVKIDKYYDRWMEFNTKLDNPIAHAAFNNRLSYDLLGKDIEDLNKEAEEKHKLAVKSHAEKQDIDINEIDEDGVSNKFKYDQAFKIQQEKNKKLISDRKLTKLKERQDELQDELDEFDRTPENKIKENLDKSLEERGSILAQISSSLKEIEKRENEISKPFDERIEKLGFDKFSTKEQSDIYDKKLAAVKKSLELDEEFDDLVSGEKLAKLIRKEQEKNREKRRKFYFNLHMEQLMELQDRDGFVYWDNSEEGKANLFNSKRGRIDYKDGKYMFTPENEEPFLVNEANKELYENQIKPGKESEWEEHKNNINKKNKKQLEESKKEVGTLLTKLNELNEKKKSLTSSVHSKRIFNTSTVRRSKDQIEELDTNDTLRKGLIKELNRLNKILNRPVFDDTLTGKEIDNQELLINRAIDEEVASLDTSIRFIQEEVGKDEKGEPQFTGTLSKAQLKVSKLEDQINKLPIPNRLKMYTVTDNEDGSFTVFQNINAIKEESISLTDTKLNEKYYKDDKGRHSIIGKDSEHNENTEVFEMLSPADLRFEKLKEFRKKLGKPINVAKNETLMEMAEKMPKTESEFLKIKGIGKVKNEKYGKQFLEFIATLPTDDSVDFDEQFKSIGIVSTKKEKGETTIKIKPSDSQAIEIADLDTISNLRGREKDSALVAEAQLEFIKAFWDKQITLERLKVEKAEIYTNENENRNNLIDKQIEISNNIARFNELRDFMLSSDLDASLVDHSDPIATQFNLILAQFVDDKEQLLFDEDAKELHNKLTEMWDKLLDFEKQVEEQDNKIEKIREGIEKQNQKITEKTSKKESVKGHLSHITKLNKQLVEAKRIRKNILSSRNYYEKEIERYEVYVDVLENRKKDIGFVREELNRLATPIQQLRDDLDKLNTSIEKFDVSLKDINRNIRLNRKIYKKLKGILDSRKIYGGKYFDSEEAIVRILDNENPDSLSSLMGDILDELGLPEEFHTRFEQELLNSVYNTDFEYQGAPDINQLKALLKDPLKGVGITRINSTDFVGPNGETITISPETAEKLSRMSNALEKATIENRKDADGVEFVKLEDGTEMTVKEIRENLNQWESELSRYTEEKKLVHKIRKEDRRKKKQIENKLQDEENIHGSTIYILSRIDRKVVDTKQSAFDKVQQLLEDIDNKKIDQIKAFNDLKKSVEVIDLELQNNKRKYNKLLEFEDIFIESWEEFAGTFSDEDVKVSDINKMIEMINGTIDPETGENKITRDLKNEIEILEKDSNLSKLELSKLDALIKLQEELKAAIENKDLDLSPRTLVLRKNKIKKAISDIGSLQRDSIEKEREIELKNNTNSIVDTVDTYKEELQDGSEELFRLITYKDGSTKLMTLVEENDLFGNEVDKELAEAKILSLKKSKPFKTETSVEAFKTKVEDEINKKYDAKIDESLRLENFEESILNAHGTQLKLSQAVKDKTALEADLEKANDKKQDPKYIEEKSDKENILNQITQIDNDVYILGEERKANEKLINDPDRIKRNNVLQAELDNVQGRLRVIYGGDKRTGLKVATKVAIHKRRKPGELQSLLDEEEEVLRLQKKEQDEVQVFEDKIIYYEEQIERKASERKELELILDEFSNEFSEVDKEVESLENQIADIDLKIEEYHELISNGAQTGLMASVAAFGAEEDVMSEVQLGLVEGQLNWTNLVRSQEGDRLKSLIERKNDAEDELEIRQALFAGNDEILKSSKKALSNKKFKLTAEDTKINNALKEEDKNTNTLEDDDILMKGVDDNLINSKSTVLSTMPTHLKWDGKEVIFDTKTKLPNLVDVDYQIRHMKFMNLNVDNMEDFNIEFVQPTKVIDKDTDEREIRNLDDPFNAVKITQVDSKTKNKTGKVLTTVEADKEFGGGLYAIITNKKGQRIYMNNEGDMRPLDDTTTHDDLEKDGYELVFTNIPNIVKTSKPGEPDRYTQTMGDNMLLNELGEVLGQSPAQEWGEVSGNNIITIRGNTYNLTNEDDLSRVKEILKNNIYIKMSKFRENVENELNKDKKVYVKIKDISDGFQLSRSKDEELRIVDDLILDKNNRLIRTTDAKGRNTTVEKRVKNKDGDIVDKQFNVTSGVLYVLKPNNNLVEVTAGKLEQDEVNTTLKLITELLDEQGAFNKQGTYETNNGESKNVNLISVGKESKDIGLLNKVLNWTGPTDNKKFSIWISGGRIQFVNKNGEKRHFPVNSIREYINNGFKKDKITDTFEKQYFDEFLLFLDEKRKHVHFQLIADENIDKEYLHPYLDKETNKI